MAQRPSSSLRTRYILIIITLATIPCYCVGLVVLQFRNTSTPTATPTITLTGTITPTVTVTPSASSTTTGTTTITH